MQKIDCEKCDGFGGIKTYENQVMMPINGKVYGIDHCIHHIVAALNAAGIETWHSCCGHKIIDATIHLVDGRVIIIKDRQDYEQSEEYKQQQVKAAKWSAGELS